jgi:hypothetical protein
MAAAHRLSPWPDFHAVTIHIEEAEIGRSIRPQCARCAPAARPLRARWPFWRLPGESNGDSRAPEQPPGIGVRTWLRPRLQLRIHV